MVEINYIHAQMIPAHPKFIEELAPELYDRLTDSSVILKEGIRVILCSELPNEEEIVESWANLRKLKENSSEKTTD